MFYTTKILQFQFLYNIPKTFYFLKLYLFTGCVGSQVWCMGCRAQGLSSCGRWAWLPCSMWGLNSLKVKVLVAQPCPTLCNPIDRNPPGSSVEFSRQEYWSGFPFPSPGDLPNPGIKPGFPALQANSLPSEPPPESPCIERQILKHWTAREFPQDFF